MAYKWTELEKTSNKTTEWGSLTSFVHSDEGFVSRLVNIDKETFVSKVIVSGTYQFKYVTTGEDGWYHNDKLVDLAEYGISPVTAPVDGHIIVVEYIAPSNTEYPSAKLVKDTLDAFESGVAEGKVVVGNATNAANAKNAEYAENAGAVNGIPITIDQDGVLKIGNAIIPQKKLLWSGSTTGNTLDPLDISSWGLTGGDTLEFGIYWGGRDGEDSHILTDQISYYKLKPMGSEMLYISVTESFEPLVDEDIQVFTLTITCNLTENKLTMHIKGASINGASTTNDYPYYRLVSVSKIIE